MPVKAENSVIGMRKAARRSVASCPVHAPTMVIGECTFLLIWRLIAWRHRPVAGCSADAVRLDGAGHVVIVR